MLVLDLLVRVAEYHKVPAQDVHHQRAIFGFGYPKILDTTNQEDNIQVSDLEFYIDLNIVHFQNGDVSHLTFA